MVINEKSLVYLFIGQSCLQTNDLPIHPGVWPTYDDSAGPAYKQWLNNVHV